MGQRSVGFNNPASHPAHFLATMTILHLQAEVPNAQGLIFRNELKPRTKEDCFTIYL